MHGNCYTMIPKEKPAITEFSMETAASARVPTWPAKTWVMAPREYLQTEVNMAGPARYHSFLDSAKHSLKKWRTPVIGGMSSEPVVKVKVVVVDVLSVSLWSCIWSCWVGESRGSCALSIYIGQRDEDWC